MKRKICIVVQSRANYARIKSVLQAVKEHPDLDLQLIVSASALLDRFGRVIDIIRKDGFEPVATVHMVIEGESPSTMAKSTGLAIVEFATIFQNLAPDIVLTIADRYETMATAIAASYMNIPLAHTQGGEITGSIDESVRHAITKLAHIHFPSTTKSAENVIRMGEDPKSVHTTGCPAMDLLTDIDLSLDSIKKLDTGTGALIDWNKPYLLVLQHPVTTEYGQGLEQINATIEAIRELNQQTVWLWPNVDAGSDHISKGLRLFREKYNPSYVHFYKNFSPENYARILNNTACILGNSSSGIREGSFLGVPCVNIGSRQNRRERGENVLNAEYKTQSVVTAVKQQMNHGRYKKSSLFGTGSAGKKIAAVLAETKLDIRKSLHY